MFRDAKNVHNPPLEHADNFHGPPRTCEQFSYISLPLIVQSYHSIHMHI